MEEEQTLTFHVAHGQEESIIELFEYDTVELLKIEIHKQFQIPTHKQIIDGWENVPETDDVILKMCVHTAITFLKIQRLQDISMPEDLELVAGFTFINKIPNLPLTFHTCKLSDAISTACLGPFKQRKVLLLYLYAKDDQFSLDLLAILRKPNVKKILQRNFFLLGWDIEDTKCHGALLEALNENALDMVVNLVKSKTNAVLCIVPIEQSVTISCCIRSKISEKRFIDQLTAVEKTVIDEVAEEEELNIIENRTDLELEAGFTFIKNIPDLPLTFHTCKLSDAISTSCLGPLKQRKVLLLYLHAKDDQFSLDLLAILRKPNVKKILQRSFFLLGWDIEDTKFHGALVETLNENELGIVVNLVKSKTNAVLCIVPIQQSVTISCCIRSKISEKSFIDQLTTVEKTVIDEVADEEELNIIENKTGTNEEMDSERFQKMMADMLGDRDYDGFAFDEHNLLKDKIGYALFGPPDSVSGYDEKKKKRIDQLFDIILRNSNNIAEYKDRVEISFIYNCLEPLPKEKIKRAKKYEDYNPKIDLMPIPIFVLRKCRECKDPCRLFIDDTGRVYKTFKDYINSNKLHEGLMVLPLNGRYTVSDDEKVRLERHPTPACGIDTMVLQGCDYASTAGGLLSGGVLIAAAIPAIPVAPVAVIGAGIVGLGVGVYSIGRSAFSLYDKHKHKESMSFADSEARGAYLNIVAGSLGFVGAGANLVVSQLVTRGVFIGRGGAALVNTIGVANIGVSGASLINSGIDAIDQWYNENQTPSLLTIVQLSSSVLFFGNAVYNFKSCATIVDETQARVLQDYQESLRSNRHRKTFNKLMKATVSQNSGNDVMGKAEVIAAVRNIQNKDEVFAVLTRSNKDMNRNGIKFTASNGEIKLNGISVDMNEFASMSKRQANSFLSNLPTDVDVTVADTISMDRMFSLNNIPEIDTRYVLLEATKLLSRYGSDVQGIIVELLGRLLLSFQTYILKILDEIFPRKLMGLLHLLIQFFEKEAQKIEDQYRKWKSTKDQIYHHPIFDHINVDKALRLLRFFEYAVKFLNSPEIVMKDLLTYTVKWITYRYVDSTVSTIRQEEQENHSESSPALKVACPICKGHYYERN